MVRMIAYELTGVFEDEKTIKLDSRVLVPPRGKVKVQVMIPEGAEGSDEEWRQARLKAWDEFMATPISDDDNRFWEELEREQRKLRRQGTASEEPL